MDVDELIRTFRGPLTGLAVSWGASAADAAEVAQDALVTAYLSRDRCRGDWTSAEDVGPFLRGVAKNVWRNRLRGESRRRRRERGAARPEALSDAAAGDAGDVREAVARLPKDLREAVLTHYLEETPVRAAAGLLGVSPKTLEGRLYRARVRLRESLGPPRGGVAAGREGGES